MLHTTVEELLVVHSSAGRLRVHLPDPGGQIAAEVRRYPGVTAVEANEVTGNMLILFCSRVTSADWLIGEIHAECGIPLPLPVALETLPAVVNGGTDSPDGVVSGYLTGTWRVVYKALGWTSVGLAVVGAITPGIPTVPFVLLASYFFIRSSPEAHRWLRESRWFGPLLRDWEEDRAVTRKVKNGALALIGAGVAITLLLDLPAAVVTTILVLEMIGLAIVLRLPVVEEAETAPVPVVE
jgi:uncharacterized membrane protein YbaN (DUF454 family)